MRLFNRREFLKAAGALVATEAPPLTFLSNAMGAGAAQEAALPTNIAIVDGHKVIAYKAQDPNEDTLVHVRDGDKDWASLHMKGSSYLENNAASASMAPPRIVDGTLCFYVNVAKDTYLQSAIDFKGLLSDEGSSLSYTVLRMRVGTRQQGLLMDAASPTPAQLASTGRLLQDSFGDRGRSVLDLNAIDQVLQTAIKGLALISKTKPSGVLSPIVLPDKNNLGHPSDIKQDLITKVGLASPERETHILTQGDGARAEVKHQSISTRFTSLMQPEDMIVTLPYVAGKPDFEAAGDQVFTFFVQRGFTSPSQGETIKTLKEAALNLMVCDVNALTGQSRDSALSAQQTAWERAFSSNVDALISAGASIKMRKSATRRQPPAP